MIAIESLGIVIITPPKNASSSLHTVLCGAKYGGVYIEGPLPGVEPIDIEAHTTLVPRRWANLKKFVAIRNPYRRAVSLYLHQVQFFGYRDGFPSFVRDKLLHPSWWYSPNVFFIPKNVAGFVHVETLAADLIAAGVQLEDQLPFDNKLTDSPREDLFEGNEIRDLVNYWAREDFSRLGYPMIGRVAPIDQATSVPVYQKWRLHE